MTTPTTKKRRLKAFSVEVTTVVGILIFLTKAKDGKEALKALISKSSDFRQLLGSKESYNMQISVKHLKG